MQIFVKCNEQHTKYVWGYFFFSVVINNNFSKLLFLFNYNFGFNIHFKIPLAFVYLTRFLTYNRDGFNCEVFSADGTVF